MVIVLDYYKDITVLMYHESSIIDFGAWRV